MGGLTMKKFLSMLLALIMMMSVASFASAESGSLVLYTSAGASEYELIVKLFN